MTKTPDELQAEIDRLSGELSSVNANNATLVKEKRAALTRAETAEADAENARNDASNVATDELTKLKSDFAKLERERNTLKTTNETLTSELKTIRVDNAIKSVMGQYDVQADDRDLVESHLLRRVEYKDGEATIEGQTITDYGKAFFDGKGKRYVKAPDNSGGGSMGNDGAKADAFQKPATASQLSPEIIRLSNDNPAQYNSLMDKWGGDFVTLKV